MQVPMMLSGADLEGDKQRAIDLLSRVGLEAQLDHKPSELSVGQQQRVALARTLVNDPNLILADEPTGNLDPETRQQVLEFLEELCREGKTVIMVTHDPAAAASCHSHVNSARRRNHFRFEIRNALRGVRRRCLEQALFSARADGPHKHTERSKKSMDARLKRLRPFALLLALPLAGCATAPKPALPAAAACRPRQQR